MTRIMTDVYKTIAKGVAEGFYSEKRSKFYAFAHHVETADEVKTLYLSRKDAQRPSLGDNDFDESDPYSRFTLPADMRPVFEKAGEETLSAPTADFLSAPLKNGGQMCKEVTGDFVAMAHFVDMEGLKERKVKGYNECGLMVTEAGGNMFQLAVFPLYNCGNMFTVTSPADRPQHPNYKGYAFDPEWIADYETGKLRSNVFVLRRSYLSPSSRYVPQSLDEEEDVYAADEKIIEEEQRIAEELAARRYYTVRSGDTLSTIASKHGKSLKTIQRLNPGVNSNRLRIGQKIRVN